MLCWAVLSASSAVFFGGIKSPAPALVPIFREPNTLTPAPGAPLWLGAFFPQDGRIDDLLDLGVKYYFSQTDPWSSPDDPQSRYPLGALLAQQRAVRQQGGRWGLVVHTAFPPYEESLLAKEGSVEWLTGERVPSWSAWDKDRLSWAGQKLAFLRDRLSSVSVLGLGIFGEYGDASFFTGGVRKDPQQGSPWLKRFGVEAPLPGFWCGEPVAQTSWGDFLKAKYGSVEGAYRAWGMETSDRLPKPVGTSYPVLARTDFLDWYRSAMPKLVSDLTRIAREIFVEVPLMVPVSPLGDNARLGTDTYAVVRSASREGAMVKVGTVGYYPFALNWVLSLGRVRSASRATGTAVWTEAPFLGEKGKIHQRIAESLSLGAGGHIDWPQAYRSDRDVLLSLLPLTVTEPVCPVAIIYPSTWAMLQGANPAPPGVLRILTELRDLMDFDILEESAIAEGALSNYRVGVLVGGTIWKKETLQAIREWVARGGVLMGYDFGKMADLGGDISIFQELFGYASILAPVQSRLRWVGEVPAHYLLSIGAEGDEEFLSGRWGPPERGGRVAYEGARIRLPVEKETGLIVSVQFAPGQMVSQVLSLRMGASVVAEVESGKELATLEFPVSAEQTARGWLEVSFEGLSGEKGVRVEGVTVRRVGSEGNPSPLIGYFEDPVLPETVRGGWARKFGQGLVIFMPGKGENWLKYISLVKYGVSHLSELDPTQKDIRVRDGKRNRVYATEFTDGVLYYNDSLQEVFLDPSEDLEAGVKVPPKQFVLIPRRASPHILVTWTETSERSPDIKVLHRGGEGIKWEVRGKLIRANERLQFRVNLPTAGRFRVFMRTLVNNRVVPVKVEIGGAPSVSPVVERESAFTFLGEFDFPDKEVEFTVWAGFDFVLEGFVLTDDLRVVGYRLAGISGGMANLPGGITRP